MAAMPSTFKSGDCLVRRWARKETPSEDAIIVFGGFPGEVPPGQAEKYAHLAGRASIPVALHEASGHDVYFRGWAGVGGNQGRFHFVPSVLDGVAFARDVATKGRGLIHIVGYSWGGLVGYNASLALGDRLGLLTLVSPVADLGGEEEMRHLLVPLMRDYPNIFDGDAVEAWAADLRSVRDRFNPTTLAAAGRVPRGRVLLVHGSRDEDVPADASRRLAGTLGLRLFELEDDHCYSAHWDRMLAELAKSLSAH